MSRIDTSDRNHFTQHIAAFFDADHLSEDLKPTMEIFMNCLADLLDELPDGIEFTAGLRKLLEAKDCMIRHAVTLRPREGGDDA